MDDISTGWPVAPWAGRCCVFLAAAMPTVATRATISRAEPFILLDCCYYNLVWLASASAAACMERGLYSCVDQQIWCCFRAPIAQLKCR